MVCPNCGKENNNTDYCSFCGSALYGPRNINLDNPNDSKQDTRNNNIESITGINIDNIAMTVEHSKLDKQNPTIKLPEFKITISSLILMGIILVLLSLCFYFGIENRKLRKDVNDIAAIKCNNKKEENSNAILGLTDNYAFKINQNWSYRQTSNAVVINNGNIAILVYLPENGQINKITTDVLANKYVEEGYTNAIASKDIINDHQIIYASFNAVGLNFIDFYYQYDSEKIIYGQISSKVDNFLSTEVKDIIASFNIHKQDNTSFNKAPVNYQNIFKLLND